MAAFQAASTGIPRKEDLTEKKDMEKDLAENVESNQSTDVIGAGLQVIDFSETRHLKYFVLYRDTDSLPDGGHLMLYTFQPTQSQIVNHHTAIELPPEIQHKEKLIKLLKKEVKRMMEVI